MWNEVGYWDAPHLKKTNKKSKTFWEIAPKSVICNPEPVLIGLVSYATGYATQAGWYGDRGCDKSWATGWLILEASVNTESVSIETGIL